jgi:hypothetical protein
MSRSQSSIRFLPKYDSPAFSAAKILFTDERGLSLRWRGTDGLIDRPAVLPEAQGVDASGAVMLDMVNHDAVRLQPLILRMLSKSVRQAS